MIGEEEFSLEEVLNKYYNLRSWYITQSNRHGDLPLNHK